MKKNLIFFCFIFSAVLLQAQSKNVFKISKTDTADETALDKYWKFHNGDDTSWALSVFDDSKWDTINTQLKFSEDGSNPFNGIGWFRLNINFDPSLDDQPVSILMKQSGASQLFLDGRLIHSYGTVSADIKKEETYNPKEIPLVFRYSKSGEHVLAVRYSNLNYKTFFKKYNKNDSGFTILLSRNTDSAKDWLNNKIPIAFIGVCLGMFFFTLSFVHLLIFIFHRKRRTNLYYSVFVVLMGMLFMLPSVFSISSNSELSIKFNYYYFILLLPVFFYSMLVLEYSIFKKSFRKSLIIASAIIILIGIIITLLIGGKVGNDLLSNFVFSFIIGTVSASFSIVLIAIIRKKEGAWIIGTGSIMFLIFMGIIILQIIFTSSVNISASPNSLSGVLFLILILLAIMSIPISMSIFLAREFSQTNKNLENKLVEVETLSQKTIEQEKEKQKILETQKETLETQVIERTSEIAGQKQLIEEKNKDITDSINYAKTIQDAILPSKELKQQIFPESFVLFKPKDIVSGDFYWFAEKNGKRLIAACDCTGHGVPGALMSMIGNNLINQIVNENGINSSGEILNHLHTEIRKTLKQGEQSDSNDGMDIAFITFSSESEIEFSGAQRPLWIVKNESGVSSLIEIKGDKYAIGGPQTETERKFTTHKIKLSKGDCIYIFTDGFADQFGVLDKKLMTSRFKEILMSIQNKSMPEQEIFLDDYIENWKGSLEQIDDMLVIGIRI